MFQISQKHQAFLTSRNLEVCFTGRDALGWQCELRDIYTKVVLCDGFGSGEPAALDAAVEKAKETKPGTATKSAEQMEIDNLRKQLEEANERNLSLAKQARSSKKKSKADPEATDGEAE
jgi:hypothetical protein